MLARLAGDCFWLGRYLERAENVARTLGVAERLAHAPEHHRDPRPLWTLCLMLCCDERRFRARGTEALADAVLSWCLLDRDNASSVVTCLRVARDNARSARHLLTADLWEALNGAWIEAQAWDRGAVAAAGGWEEACAWTSRQCLLARGAALELPRGELPHVLALGRAVERAAYTATVLALSPIATAGDAPCPPGSELHRRVEAALRAAGGADGYERAGRGGRGGLRPCAVASFLIADPDSPRSLAANARVIAESILGMTGNQAELHQRSLPAAGLLAEAVRLADEHPGPDTLRAVAERLWSLSDLIEREHFAAA